jgi:hypothetical protein
MLQTDGKYKMLSWRLDNLHEEVDTVYSNMSRRIVQALLSIAMRLANYSILSKSDPIGVKCSYGLRLEICWNLGKFYLFYFTQGAR